MSAEPQTDAPKAPNAEVLADFLRRMRLGIEDGLDPKSAAQRAALDLPKSLRDAVERLSQRLRGEYHEDEWGFDEQFAEAVYPLFEFLYDTWWRVEADGVRHVPAHGRALLVANHAGSLFPFDASMILGAIMKEHPLPRWARFLVLDWAFVLPFLSTFMRRVGGVPASPHNATRLLQQDELVMAFPEGAKGTGKQFSERYRLQRFGRGGFVEVALRAGAPIIPVAVVGARRSTRSSPTPSRWRGPSVLPSFRSRRPFRGSAPWVSSPFPRGGGSSSASRSSSPGTGQTPPTISGSCSTSRSRSGRRSRRSSTRTWSSGARPSSSSARARR